MAGSKLYVRKPLRRYERDFETSPTGADTPAEEGETPAVHADITSAQPPAPVSIKASAVRRVRVAMKKKKEAEDDREP